MSLNNSLKRASDTLSDTIRRKFSRKTWEHKEQLHTVTESVSLKRIMFSINSTCLYKMKGFPSKPVKPDFSISCRQISLIVDSSPNLFAYPNQSIESCHVMMRYYHRLYPLWISLLNSTISSNADHLTKAINHRYAKISTGHLNISGSSASYHFSVNSFWEDKLSYQI